MRDRVVRAGGMGENSIKRKERKENKENTKVLEYPIVITTVGAFNESPSSVRRRAQYDAIAWGTMNDTSMFESM